ncbi:NADP-dependent malic enzyme [Candidatus Saccharibacteria bacterium]|jgi:malate dehydrogenase (oxaloacetate-decarboxylating)|nr:NADP-dependent malic enzyme [Candidatus Saccharibacteria bacterium]
MDYNKLALDLHKKYKGKLTTRLRDERTLDKDTLSAYYSPGVAEVSRKIAKDPSQLPNYTWTNNLVAVISDGSAVLGLGDIGPRASMPVMEGKGLLFKYFADIDSVPITLDVHEPDEIINTIKAIHSSFGAINLEDIAAPKCFEIEKRLKEELDIPVFHDDQHGTAIVTLAGLINSMKVTGKTLSNCKIVLIGAGAAGVAIADLLHKYAQPNIIAIDSRGVISKDRTDLNEHKLRLAGYAHQEKNNNPTNLQQAIKNADIVIGISKGNMLSPDDISSMNEDAIVFGLANPIPEIMPDIAKQAGAAIVATGRSDLPNQVNNAIAFPGIFRGALDNGVKKITDNHKIAAAEVIASLVDSPNADNVIPSVLNEKLVPSIAKVIN